MTLVWGGSSFFIFISITGGIGMLVLGRKPGEYVMIGDDIMVKVVRSDRGDLRLAISAPDHVKITRGEVYEAEQRGEMREAEG